MATTITVPALGAVDADVRTLATQAAADVNALQAGTTVTGVNGVTMPAGGALTTGTVLRATGAAAAAYGAVDLANASAVTGLLPTANQAPGTAAQFAVTNAGATAKVDVAMSGDATMASTGVVTVAKVNGATYPAAGALTTGTVPRVTGASAVEYGALDLANASAVTGVLPGANVLSKKTVTSDHTTLVAAAGTETVNIGTALPANSRIVGVDIHTLTPFSGGTIGDFTVDVGMAGDVDALIDGADLFAGAVDSGPATIPKGIRPNKFYAAGGQLIATFLCGSDDVGDATAGAVTIDVTYIVLA